MAIGPCAYCGEERTLTDDHVPPKLWLEIPYPDNLVTVPACEDCNKKFQKNDEYTRTVIALDFRAAENSTVHSTLPRILRSLQRPEARGFSEYLKGQLKESDLVDSLGRPLGIRAEVDQSRIDATGERIGKRYPERFSDWAGVARRVAGGQRDRRKQAALYVGIGEDGDVESLPTSSTGFEEEIERAKALLDLADQGCRFAWKEYEHFTELFKAMFRDLTPGRDELARLEEEVDFGIPGVRFVRRSITVADIVGSESGGEPPTIGD